MGLGFAALPDLAGAELLGSPGEPAEDAGGEPEGPSEHQSAIDPDGDGDDDGGGDRRGGRGQGEGMKWE